jgi:uncharacterized Zn-finger protein
VEAAEVKSDRSPIGELTNMVRDIFDKHGIKISMRNARLHAMDLYARGCRVQIEGEWIETVEHKTILLKLIRRKEKIYCCPYCGRVYKKRMNYCGHCGVKMKGGESDAE